MRNALGWVPAPLALLLPVVALFGVAWALLVPAWQAPDEDAHFGYVQSLAERGELPGKGPNPVSTEQRRSMLDTNTDPTVFFEFAKPESSRVAERAWLRRQGSYSRSDGGGADNAAAGYPPAYYLYETVPYVVSSSGTVLTRLYVARLFSVLWLLVSTVGVWLLAGELLERRRSPQLVAAAAFGLWPMLTFVSASVNPDSMLIALWTLALWLGVKVIRGGLTPARGAALCGCVGFALVTKATAFALVPPAAFAIAAGLWALRGRINRRRALMLAGGLVALVVPVVAWLAWAHVLGRAAYGQADIVTSSAGGGAGTGTTGSGRAATAHVSSLREFGSYLWQFYLPKLPFQQTIQFVFPVISHYPAYEVWLGSGWATFGWANVWFPSGVYLVFLLVTVIALAGALATVPWLRLRRSAQRQTLLVGAFVAIAVITLLAGLHITDYRMYANHKAPFMQGRYLLPVGAIAALVLAQATRALPARARQPGVAVVLGGLVVLQIACLGLVAGRYYA